MPAKATLFNSKCEAIYDFGTGARNECFFNQLGNNILFVVSTILRFLFLN